MRYYPDSLNLLHSKNHILCLHVNYNFHLLVSVFAGFWGGLVPENAFNASTLENLLSAGALGLKVLVN